MAAPGGATAPRAALYRAALSVARRALHWLALVLICRSGGLFALDYDSIALVAK